MTDFKKVFVDTAPIIYYLENSPLYSEVVKRFFATCIEKNIKVVTSAVTVEEYLVYPYSSGQMDLAECDMFFTNDRQLRQEKEIPCMTMEDLQ